MKVADVLKKLGEFENVCVRQKDKHPHDTESMFGTAKQLLADHPLHLALRRPVYRILTGEWEKSHCVFIIYK